MKYFTADIETTGLIERGKFPDIICSALAQEGVTTTFHGGNVASKTHSFIQGMIDSGMTLVTFNGSKFDLPIIGHHLGYSINSIVGNHIDLMLCIKTALGHKVNQKSLYLRNNLPIDYPIMSSRVPEIYATGNISKILSLCSHDANNLLSLVNLAKKEGGLYVPAKSGTKFLPFDLLTAGELNGN